MIVVSFETAKRLKEAGFPQPDRIVGQVWYDKKPYFIGYIDGQRFSGIYTGIGIRIDDCHFAETANDFFAPTATDILRELPGCAVEFWQPKRLFYVENVFGVQWVNENPAEAAAKAWIELNNKI